MNLFSLQPVTIAASSPDEDGVLVFIEGRLTAIISKLAADFHGALQGRWFIEVGFGQCDAALAPPSFRFPSEALCWIVTQTGDDARIESAELLEIDRRLGTGLSSNVIAANPKFQSPVAVRQKVASGVS